MSEIAYSKDFIDQGKAGKGTLVQWEGVTENDTFKQFKAPAFSDASVQVDGTYGSATVLIKGTNDTSGGNLQSLVDIFENAMSYSTNPAIRQLAQNPLIITPSASGGTGQSINVRILFYSNN